MPIDALGRPVFNAGGYSFQNRGYGYGGGFGGFGFPFTGSRASRTMSDINYGAATVFNVVSTVRALDGDEYDRGPVPGYPPYRRWGTGYGYDDRPQWGPQRTQWRDPTSSINSPDYLFRRNHNGMGRDEFRDFSIFRSQGGTLDQWQQHYHEGPYAGQGDPRDPRTADTRDGPRFPDGTRPEGTTTPPPGQTTTPPGDNRTPAPPANATFQGNGHTWDLSPAHANDPNGSAAFARLAPKDQLIELASADRIIGTNGQEMQPVERLTRYAQTLRAEVRAAQPGQPVSLDAVEALGENGSPVRNNIAALMARLQPAERQQVGTEMTGIVDDISARMTPDQRTANAAQLQAARDAVTSMVTGQRSQSNPDGNPFSGLVAAIQQIVQMLENIGQNQQPGQTTTPPGQTTTPPESTTTPPGSTTTPPGSTTTPPGSTTTPPGSTTTPPESTTTPPGTTTTPPGNDRASIQAYQARLESWGLSTGNRNHSHGTSATPEQMDGLYRNVTTASTARFQAAWNADPAHANNQLPTDGAMDPATMTAVMSSTTPPAGLVQTTTPPAVTTTPPAATTPPPGSTTTPPVVAPERIAAISDAQTRARADLATPAGQVAASRLGNPDDRADLTAKLASIGFAVDTPANFAASQERFARIVGVNPGDPSVASGALRVLADDPTILADIRTSGITNATPVQEVQAALQGVRQQRTTTIGPPA